MAVLLAQPGICSDSTVAEPIADAGLPRYAAQDAVVLDGMGSYDPDNSVTLSYMWRQISGPAVVVADANTATPAISGFVQTNEIQECEFELVVSDGELTSLPDTVKVIIVPDFGENMLRHVNPPFNPSKPTFIFFGGGDCIIGFPGISGTWDDSSWNSRANVIDFSLGYEPDSLPDPNYTPAIVDGPGSYFDLVDGPRTYYRCGDMIIAYLSSVAPNYQQLIQTAGWSTGGQPAIDVGIHLNLTYADARYAVNRVTLIDARSCRDYSDSIPQFLGSSVDGEQCWIDLHRGNTVGVHTAWPSFYPNVLRVGSSMDHVDVVYWYAYSLTNSDMNQFNHGVVGGVYWSVLGPGKNLQLASTPGVETYSFRWHGDQSSGYMDFYDEPNHPGRLPEPVTLIGPVYAEDHNGVILSCEESENAVGYQLLFGPDPHRVMDYEIISDTPAPPNDVITTLPFDEGWWTVRVRDQYGSTIYADPAYLSAFATTPIPADGAVHPDTWANLMWTEGISSASYDVYFGENFVDVQDGSAEVFQGNQAWIYFSVGFAGFPYPDGLVRSKTYFWRIDDVGADGTVMNKGKIWSFTVSP
ncbi:MAG: PKD domain-containing protein [Planctomycetota bacterium]